MCVRMWVKDSAVEGGDACTSHGSGNGSLTGGAFGGGTVFRLDATLATIMSSGTPRLHPTPASPAPPPAFVLSAMPLPHDSPSCIRFPMFQPCSPSCLSPYAAQVSMQAYLDCCTQMLEERAAAAEAAAAVAAARAASEAAARAAAAAGEELPAMPADAAGASCVRACVACMCTGVCVDMCSSVHVCLSGEPWWGAAWWGGVGWGGVRMVGWDGWDGR
mgnify:CR=1 FL=1